jgi:hypothetical protein
MESRAALQRLAVDGSEMAHVDAGAGDPIVLVSCRHVGAWVPLLGDHARRHSIRAPATAVTVSAAAIG